MIKADAMRLSSIVNASDTERDADAAVLVIAQRIHNAGACAEAPAAAFSFCCARQARSLF